MKNGTFKYRSEASGIVKVTLKTSAKSPGEVRFAVAGKGGSYPFDLAGPAPYTCPAGPFSGTIPTGSTATQIANGAPADVFAAANTSIPASLYAQGLVEKPVNFTRNTLVIVVPKGNPAGIKGIFDLTKRYGVF